MFGVHRFHAYTTVSSCTAASQGECALRLCENLQNLLGQFPKFFLVVPQQLPPCLEHLARIQGRGEKWHPSAVRTDVGRTQVPFCGRAWDDP